MPTKNLDFSQRFDELTLNPATNAALDTLLGLNVAENPTAFRAAIIAQRAVFENPVVHPDLYTGAEGHDADDEFLSVAGDAGRDNGLADLQRKAAHKRIVFGLPNDLADLKELFAQDNPAAMQAWFTAKPGLFGTHNWGAEPSLLTHNALVDIRRLVKTRIIEQIVAGIAEFAQKNTTAAQEIQVILNKPLLSADDLQALGTKLQLMIDTDAELDTYMARQNEFLYSPHLNEAERDNVYALNSPIYDQLQSIKNTVRGRVLAYIQNEHGHGALELNAEDGYTWLELDAAQESTAEVLQQKLGMLTLRLAKVNSALGLAELTSTDDILDDEDEEEVDDEVEVDDEDEAGAALDEDDFDDEALAPEQAPLTTARAQKKEIETAIVTLKILSHAKSVQKIREDLAGKITEITNYIGRQPEKLVGQAESIFKKMQDAATKCQTELNDALDQLSSQEEKERLDAINITAQGALKDAKSELEVARLVGNLQYRPHAGGKLYPNRGSVLAKEGFTTHFVKKDKPLPPDVGIRPAADALHVQFDNAQDNAAPANPRHAKMEPGDRIYSKIKFGPQAEAVLTQDENGKVSYNGSGALTLEQRILVAMQQAQMLLLNYDPASQNKVIYIRGNPAQAEQACVLLAVMLQLQKNCPALASLKFVSEIADCEVPKPIARFLMGARNQHTVNQDFIQKHLADHAESATMKALAKEITGVMEQKTTGNAKFVELKRRIHDTKLGDVVDDTDDAVAARRLALAEEAKKCGIPFDVEEERPAAAPGMA